MTVEQPVKHGLVVSFIISADKKVLPLARILFEGQAALLGINPKLPEVKVKPKPVTPNTQVKESEVNLS